MANTKPQVKIVDASTGEEIVRDANATEIAQLKIDAQNEVTRIAEAEAKAAEEAAKQQAFNDAVAAAVAAALAKQ